MNPPDPTYKIQLELRIDWSELDYFGHVNNVSFFKYIQAARVNYWDQTGLTDSHRKTNIGPILASAKCDFKHPLHYPGAVTIYSKVDTIGNTSFNIVHQLFNETGKIVAEALDIIVMYDFNRNEKIPVPTNLKQQIKKLEKQSF